MDLQLAINSNRPALGANFENLGSKSGLYLSCEQGRWSLVQLNCLHRLLRYLFGCYSNTHIKNVVHAIARESATQDLLFINRIQYCWQKSQTAAFPILRAPAIPISSTTATTLDQHAKTIVNTYLQIPPRPQVLQSYQYYISNYPHRYQGQSIFNGADFHVRHGAMHHCHVSLLIAPLVRLYQNAGDTRAQALTQREIDMLSLAALFHDYGRMGAGNDLGGDTHEMEEIGADACYQYLRTHFGASHAEAENMRQACLGKDSPLAHKTIYQEILQNADCLAVLRSDDWLFNSAYSDFHKRIENNSFSEGAARKQELHRNFDTFIVANKRFLVQLGDSPYDMTTSSGQVIQGSYTLATKQFYEKHPDCFALMKQIYTQHLPA